MKTGKKGLWEPLWYVLYAFAGLGLELLLAGVIEPLWTKGKGFFQYTAGDDAVTCEEHPKNIWGLILWLGETREKCNRSGPGCLP